VTNNNDESQELKKSYVLDSLGTRSCLQQTDSIRIEEKNNIMEQIQLEVKGETKELV
jgi:hypothetical protein